MLTLTVPMSAEHYDEEKQRFVVPVTFTLELEHSLASLSKWESRWEKPFLGGKTGREEKTTEEILWYIRAMTLTPDVPEEVFQNLTEENLGAINDYINSKQSATWFTDSKAPHRPGGEIITAELMYYWMVALNIDWEAQYWHLNRFIALVRICNEKNAPKKMSRREAGQRQRDLNAQRRAALGTRG